MKITLQFSVSVATWALSLSAHVQGVFGAELSGKGVLKALETGGLDIQRLTSAPSSCSSAVWFPKYLGFPHKIALLTKPVPIP